MALNWTSDQPWEFYNRLVAADDPALPALDDALDIIENACMSPAARPRSIEAMIAPPPVWLVDVRHHSGDLQILWQEDQQGSPALLSIGPARFPKL